MVGIEPTVVWIDWPKHYRVTLCQLQRVDMAVARMHFDQKDVLTIPNAIDIIIRYIIRIWSGRQATFVFFIFCPVFMGPESRIHIQISALLCRIKASIRPRRQVFSPLIFHVWRAYWTHILTLWSQELHITGQSNWPHKLWPELSNFSVPLYFDWYCINVDIKQ